MSGFWSWALTLVGLTCFYLAGRKVWWAWYVGIAGQGLWLAYSLGTQQWGFLAGVAAYSVVYVRNAVAWTREYMAERGRVMTQDEREDFFADDAGTFGAHADRDGSEQPMPYDDAVRSFVGTVQALTATERRLAEAEAKVARVEALADSLDVLGNLPIEERPDGLTATVKACTALAGDLRAALKGADDA